MSKLTRLVARLRGKKNPPPKKADVFPTCLSPEDKAIWSEVKAFTLTDKWRVLALILSVQHIVKHNLPGCIVECGVWRGGSMMAIARALLNRGIMDRKLYLFDTFQGMPAPCEKDRHFDDDVRAQYEAAQFSNREGSSWCYAPLEEVRRNLESTGYPTENLHFIPGKVEDTLPVTDVPEIAMLRLDTDFYESTKAEMEYLYPKLTSGGILLLDDYYNWLGSKDAVDEYIAEHNIPIMLMTLGGGGAVAGAKP